MTIEQLLFVGPNLTPNQPTSLNGPYMQLVYSPPQVNYVATNSMPAPTNNLVGDVVLHSLGALESGISIGLIDIYPFHSIVIQYDENLLQDMVSHRS